jgi:uncharacterized protein YutE (UPF0331/DUF86 family)
MTPPALDVAACQEKLALQADLLADLDRQGSPSADDLRGDRDRRHVIERILTQLVDIAVGLNALLLRGYGHRRPSSYRESFTRMAEVGIVPVELATRLGLAAGMRNILTHEYGQIDLDLVAATVPAARQDFGAYVRHVRNALLAPSDN